MNTVEVLLVLVGIPLAIIAVLALLTLPGGRKRTRYKPGQSWDHAPVWYEPHPENPVDSAHGPAPSSGPAAVPGASTAALGSSMYPEQRMAPRHTAPRRRPPIGPSMRDRSAAPAGPGDPAAMTHSTTTVPGGRR